jgi:pimeloyl-ACP methyl ester carboxylesterase
MKPASPYFLPGLLCDETIWTSQLQDLAEFGAVACAGYGDARSIAEMAERALASAPPVMSLAGHSMGARVALEIVRIAPERVERLALLDTGVHGVGPGEAEKRYALLKLGREKGIEALVDAWLPPMVHPDRRGDPELMDRLRAMCVSAGVDRFEAQITALLARPDAGPLLPTITCPVLVGVGRQDEWSPPAQNQAIAAAFPNAEFVIFEDCGHMAPAEAPDQVNAALRRWLARAA